MSPLFLSLLASGFLLASFVALLNIETKYNMRVLGGSRSWLDSKLLVVYRTIGHAQIHFGTGAVRFYLHFFIHKVLALVLTFLKRIERSLSRVQQRNRTVAESVQQEQDNNHLKLIAEHKATNALSPAQKQKLKNKSIGSV